MTLYFVQADTPDGENLDLFVRQMTAVPMTATPCSKFGATSTNTIWKSISKFFRELLSEGRQMYVDLASWHAITQGGAGQAESKAQEDDEQPSSHGAPGK